MSAILDRIGEFLNQLHTDERCGPPTLLFNEGWMLRLVLDAAARGARCLPAQFQPGARWYTEALLYSPFAARTRGDRLAESATHADGVIGHFDVGKSSRGGLHVAADATQLVVAEAKMFSPLSSGTTRAQGYDQAARNVACLAWALSRAGRPLDSYRSLGFWVLAPEEQHRTGAFACVSRMSVETKIRARIDAYDSESRHTKLDPWFRDWLLPLLEQLQIVCLSWEQVLSDISQWDAAYGHRLADFYAMCLQFNRLRPAGGTQESA